MNYHKNRQRGAIGSWNWSLGLQIYYITCRQEYVKDIKELKAYLRLQDTEA
jgi:hypothetical protein